MTFFSGETLFLFYIAVFLVSFFGVELFRRWSLRRELFDVPNERSSHIKPTPRGGGLIIVIVCLTTYTILTLFVTGNFQWTYVAGSVFIAVISWLDDVYSISFVWRILVHALSALLVISDLGYFSEIYLPFFHLINISVIGAGLTFLWIVWLTNAYNFMDGIDGIAGMQAVTAGIGWFLIGNIFNLPTVSFYGGVLAVSNIGFLIKNWQPAQIFMGDVGSAFLGYSFAVLPLLAKTENGQKNEVQLVLLPIAVLLVWLFVFDTVWTFARRAFMREKVWQAHRSHLYQKLVIARFSHQTVTLLYGLISAEITLALIFAVFFWTEEDVLSKFVLIVSIIVFSVALLITVYLLQRTKGKIIT